MTGSDWLTQAWALKLGWTLVHFLWQGAVLSLLAGLLLFALRNRSAGARYWTACFLFFGMALLPAITYRWIEVGTATVSGPLQMNLDLENSPLGIPLAQPDERTPEGIAETGPPLGETKTEASSLLAGQETILQALEPHLPWMVMAWLLGVALLSVRHFFGWVLVRRLRRRFVEPVSEEIARRSRELAGHLRISRPVVVLKSQLARAPLTLGWLRPVILLPASTLSGLSRTQLAAILAHELAHIRRHDYLINLFQIAVETLLFYHPGVWWISRRIRIERENCCDDIAVRVCGDATVYARALAEVASLEMDPSPALSLADGSLTSRIRRLLLLQPEATSPKTFSGWFAGIVIVALITAFAVVGEGEESRAVEKDSEGEIAMEIDQASPVKVSPYAYDFGEGRTLELLAVTEKPTNEEIDDYLETLPTGPRPELAEEWWDPYGSPTKSPVEWDRVSGSIFYDSVPGKRNVALYMGFDGPWDDLSPWISQVDFEGEAEYPATSTSAFPGVSGAPPAIWSFTLMGVPEDGTATLHLKVPNGEYRTLGVHTPDYDSEGRAARVTVFHADFEGATYKGVFSAGEGIPGSEEMWVEGETQIWLEFEPIDVDARVVAFLKSGEELNSTASSRNPSSSTQQALPRGIRSRARRDRTVRVSSAAVSGGGF